MTIAGVVAAHGRMNTSRFVAEVFVNSSHKVFDVGQGTPPAQKQAKLENFGMLIEEHLKEGALFVAEIRWGQYLGGARGRKFT